MSPRLAVVGLLAVASSIVAAPVEATGFEACLATRGEQVIASVDADRHMVPASVAKLVVTAAALHHLGPDFRTTTALASAVRPHEGVLTGDLVLVAGGDPSWSSRFYPDDPRQPLRQLADQLVAAGVRHVDGDLVLDLSPFPGRPFPTSRAIGELAYGWAAPTSGVAVDENRLALDIAPGSRVGAPARASWADGSRLGHPPRIDNRMVTAPRERHERGTVDVLPSWHASTLHLRGEYPISEPSYRMDVAVPDPVHHAGRALVAMLDARGITITGDIVPRTTPIEAPIRLAVLRSPPLAELLPPISSDSRNWHAEMLLRVVAREVTGAGRSDDGLDALIDFLESTVGITAGDVHLDDASGISPYSLITPRAIVRLLRFVLDQPWRDAYVDALARPGVGSLTGWPALPPTLRAKTGTGRHTLALAGVVLDRADDPLVFACASNHRVDARPAQRRELAARVRGWTSGR
ncbi:MAG: D-alanyl-D-alanine carboxypeptidase/D-alanyl-D-alanine-endopeptidase [Acidobacteriota bacterium]